jgi:hypothetical protein
MSVEGTEGGQARGICWAKHTVLLKPDIIRSVRSGVNQDGIDRKQECRVRPLGQCKHEQVA